MRIVHLGPSSLLRYVRQLDEGFSQGPHTLHHCDKGVEASVEAAADLARTEAVLLLVEWHGSQNEVPVVDRAMKAVRGLQDRGQALCVGVLVHRPEEIILRYGVGGTRGVLAGADLVFLLGPACVPVYEALLSTPAPQSPPPRVRVVPHGFFSPGTAGCTLGYNGTADGAVVVVGSVTTWGELRQVEDLVGLNQALLADNGPPVVCVAAGSFLDQYADAQAPWVDSALHVLVCQAAVEEWHGQYQAAHPGATPVQAQASYRQWLHTQAEGRVVVRATLKEGIVHGDPPVPVLEDGLHDFNVQLYREVLADRRKAAEYTELAQAAGYGAVGTGAPKVEYSGSLHMSGGPAVGVVFESPAMDDVGTHEGVHMVAVPWAEGRDGSTQVDYITGAQRIRDVVCSEQRWRGMVEANVATAARWSMAIVATRYTTLAAEVGQ